MVDGMVDPCDPEYEQFRRVMALHKYFLNADFLRDVFMRRIGREQSPADVDFVTSMDDMIALSLWYATVYVVIEGWLEARLTDPELDGLLADDKADDLRRFRNQVFHYQREYDNPKLLEFLGTNHADAQAATDWIRRTHAALGRAIEKATQDLLDHRGAAS
jgi:hypothetical protein